MSAVVPFPYKGTLNELATIRREISELQQERAQLDIEMGVLQNHQACVLKLIRQNSRGGR